MPRNNPNLTPQERRLRGQLAAHTRWAACEDRTAATAAATKASLGRFERQVDPDGTLPPEERAKRAESAKKAYMAKIQLAAAKARRQKAAANTH